MARRVEVADPDRLGFPISNSASFENQPDVAASGSTFLVAWDIRPSGVDDDIHARRVSSAGALVGTGRIIVSDADGRQTTPAVASDGSGFYLAWADNRTGGLKDIYGGRVNSAGTRLDGEGDPIATAANEHSDPPSPTTAPTWWPGRRRRTSAATARSALRG